MSSEGTGSPISQQDTIDLLHKLITESTKVHGVFTSDVGSIRAAVTGIVSSAPGGSVLVVDSDRPRDALLTFDPARAVVCKYADARAMLDGGEAPFRMRFRSVLGFLFEDGSRLSLFELADPAVAEGETDD